MAIEIIEGVSSIDTSPTQPHMNLETALRNTSSFFSAGFPNAAKMREAIAQQYRGEGFTEEVSSNPTSLRLKIISKADQLVHAKVWERYRQTSKEVDALPEEERKFPYRHEVVRDLHHMTVTAFHSSIQEGGTPRAIQMDLVQDWDGRWRAEFIEFIPCW